MYDRLGRLSTVAHNGTTTTRTYNGASELLSESYAGGTLGGLAVTNDYDALLRRSSARVASYATTLNSYTYDGANRLRTVGDATNSATYAYVTNSPLIAQVLSKQNATERLRSDRSYDLLDRLYLMNSVPAGGNTGAFLFGYGYNQLNQRVMAGAMEDGYWKNAYDWRGQLTNSVRRWSDNSLVAGEQYSYAFDDIGNRKSTLQGGNLAGQNLRSATYTNNTQNQITGRGVGHSSGTSYRSITRARRRGRR